MYRLLVPLLVCSLLLSGCGAVIVNGTINSGAVTASGVVSIVRLTLASNGTGSSITVTVVTLVQSGTAQDLTFCGSQVNLFPMNTAVTTKFTQGSPCSTLISVSSLH